MSFGLLVHQHYGLLDLAKLVEVGLDLIGRGLLADAAHKNLFGLICFGLAFGCCMFGVNLFSIQ